MNIKTLQRAAKRQGFKLTEEYNREFKEKEYTLTDIETGREIWTNDKKYLAAYLAGLLPCLDE